VSSRFSFV